MGFRYNLDRRLGLFLSTDPRPLPSDRFIAVASECASGRRFVETSYASITDFLVSPHALGLLAITRMERNRGRPRVLIVCFVPSPVDVRRCAFVLSYLSYVYQVKTSSIHFCGN